jgi:hypothetical protein
VGRASGARAGLEMRVHDAIPRMRRRTIGRIPGALVVAGLYAPRSPFLGLFRNRSQARLESLFLPV